MPRSGVEYEWMYTFFLQLITIGIVDLSSKMGKKQRLDEKDFEWLVMSCPQKTKDWANIYFNFDEVFKASIPIIGVKSFFNDIFSFFSDKKQR